ncbi:MAG: acyl-CoA synthetase [Gammaproteobacteria bacterium]|nr:acyl-CoA synthetase [Gammaproteobacteria bacterium]
MELQFASAWEAITDAVPDRIALISKDVQRSWAEYDDRAARIAAVLDANDLGENSKVGLYLHNCNEYLEAQYAAFKIGGCPINVNYRYKADELVYLLDNSDAEAVVYQGCYAMRIWEIRDRLPKVKAYIQLDDGTESLLDGSLDFEACIGGNAPMPRVVRDPAAVYMLYTGGTTGLPKGVMYPGGEFCYFLAAMGATGRGVTPPQNVDELAAYVGEIDDPPISLVACPLMHGTGMWLGSMGPLLSGGTVVTTPKLGLDPDLIWSLVKQHAVTDLTIVGDAFARPLLVALDEAQGRGNPHDLGSLKQIISSGVMWSREIKEGLLRHHDMVLVDAMGSTEGGMGSSVTTRESTAETAKFQLSEGVRVIADDGREVEPGSGEIGKIASSGLVPLGYYKDPEKSAETFREIDGKRYSFPGDYATVEADGSISLLGRGNACINTAGEKVFPEEVEEAVKRHPDVFDCLVVGVPDERFGEKVVAVASLHEGRQSDEVQVIDFTREQLAGYKLPKQVLIVDTVQRAPNGKADYQWAKRVALAEAK